MATSTEIKQRANTLADKTDVNSITPKEVGGIMYDLASHGENVLRNGGTLGIRKVYESVAAMEADSTNPKDFWGDPIKKGNLVVIYDGTTTGVDNNKIYAFMKPGWQIATHLDAGYATKAGLDAAIENVLNSLRNSENALNESIDSLEETVTGNKKEVDEKLAELASEMLMEMLMLEQGGISTKGYDTISTTRVRTLGYINGGKIINTEGDIIIWGCLSYDSSTFEFVKFSQIKKNKVILEEGYVYRLTFAIGDGKSDVSPREIYGYTQGVSLANLYNENNRNAFESKLKANAVLNSGWVDYGMVTNVGSSGYDGYVGTPAWDTLWIYILEGTTRVELGGIVFGSFRFFDDITTNVANHLGANSTGDIIGGAKLCLVSLKKADNPNGYDNLQITQIGGEYSTKDYANKGFIQAARNVFVEKYHKVDSTGNYLYDKSYCSVWVNIDKDAEAISIENATAEYYNMFSNYTATSENYLGRSSTGRIVHNDTKLIIINVPISSVDNISNISVKLFGSKNNIPSSRNFIVAYKRLVNIAEDGSVSYISNDNYNCLWVHLLDNVKSVKVVGINASRTAYYKGAEISDENYLGTNNTGIVPVGSTFCIINHKTEGELTDYNKVTVIQTLDFVDNRRFNDLFDAYIENIPNGKNFIDKDNLLTGYVLDSGKLIERSYGKLSNRIYLENGKYYTAQGIYYYGTKNKIFICCFDKNDNFIGSKGFVATVEEASTNHTGNATFLWDSNDGLIDHVRVVLQASASYPFNGNIAQLEEGEIATEVVPYQGTEKLNLQIEGDFGNKKKIKLLAIGNSYTQDALAYVPYILQNMGIDVDIQIGILMESSAPLSNHVANFTDEKDAYYFYRHDGGMSWKNLGLKSIQYALDEYTWDIVCMQQSSQKAFDWSSYQPHCNNLINLISKYTAYPIKFMWYQPMARPAQTNSGVNWNDEVITEHYESTAYASERIMKETVIELLVPVGTAIQNARTISSIKAMGDYANNPNNKSGLGYLTPNDGVHLQEGLPCQIAAYTFVLSLLKEYGFSERSILGESTRVTTEWASGKSIPSPHGDYIGSTDENCIIAQQCAIMAVKNPYQVTDMVELGIVYFPSK